ncbi:hypothetical protein BaRGS_00018103, partial [Batillaria attramentaria]
LILTLEKCRLQLVAGIVRTRTAAAAAMLSAKKAIGASLATPIGDARKTIVNNTATVTENVLALSFRRYNAKSIHFPKVVLVTLDSIQRCCLRLGGDEAGARERKALTAGIPLVARWAPSRYRAAPDCQCPQVDVLKQLVKWPLIVRPRRLSSRRLPQFTGHDIDLVCSADRSLYCRSRGMSAEFTPGRLGSCLPQTRLVVARPLLRLFVLRVAYEVEYGYHKCLLV